METAHVGFTTCLPDCMYMYVTNREPLSRQSTITMS